MEQKKSKRLALRIAGVAIGAVLVGAVIASTDLHALALQMQTVGWYFFGAIGVTFVAQFIAVVAWYKSFYISLPKSSLLYLFNFRLIGESLAQINPTSVIAGETIKGFLLKTKLGVTYLEGAASLLLSRIMIIIGSLVLLVFGIGVMFQKLAYGSLQTLSIAISAGILILAVLFILALATGKGVLGWLAKLLQKNFARFTFARKAADGLVQVDAKLVEFYAKRRGAFYTVFILSVLHRVVGAMEYYVIFYALGIDVSPLSCILFDLTTMLFKVAGFFIPGQLGLEEFGNKLIFSLVNIPGNETWITVSLVRRGRQLFWILLGFMIYLFFSKSAKQSEEIKAETAINKTKANNTDEDAVCNT